MSQPAIDFANLAPARTDGQPPWLVTLRDAARKHFMATGLPTRRDENWKYTNLRALQRGKFQLAGPVSLQPGDIPTLDDEDLPAVSFVNGKLHERRHTAGLSLRLLSECVTEDAEAYRSYFGTLPDYDNHPMAALNTAMFDEALVIQTEPGREYELPLLLEYISAPDTQPVMICPRVLIVMAPNSSLSIVERNAGLVAAANYSNSVTEVHLQQGAKLEHYRIQEHNEDELSTSLIRVRQDTDSSLIARCVDLGGKLVRNDLHTSLTGAGASVTMTGFYMAIERQHIDNHTRVDHDAPHTVSHETYHGVLAGRARAVFNGKVIVAPNAQKVDASQSNRNLLLSTGAEIDTKPELEIYADDVRCSHGATVGQLDEEALFYLRTRGIGERTARALLTFAFADEVLRDFSLPELRQYIEQIVAHRLPDHERLEVLI